MGREARVCTGSVALSPVARCDLAALQVTRGKTFLFNRKCEYLQELLVHI